MWWWKKQWCGGHLALAAVQMHASTLGLGALSTELCYGQGLRMREVIEGEHELGFL